MNQRITYTIFNRVKIHIFRGAEGGYIAFADVLHVNFFEILNMRSTVTSNILAFQSSNQQIPMIM